MSAERSTGSSPLVFGDVVRMSEHEMHPVTLHFARDLEREFQAEYDTAGPPLVRVRLQARLIRLPRRTSLAATSEEFVVRASNTSVPAIVTAFDEAFGKALKRIVEWAIQEAAAAQA